MDTRVYPNTQLYIDGAWSDAAAGRRHAVMNPATGTAIGTFAWAERADLDRALEAAEKGFAVWKKVSAYERSKIMRKAANLLRERIDLVARLMTMEQGKTLAEARAEINNGADTIDWFAEEGRRTYGRVIPARAEGIYQLVVKEPVGPVAAFTPWNFPINQIVRKLSAALAAGCSIIVKAPEETPASPAELIRAFVDAGVPAGAVGLVYGDPAEISSYLIPHPVIRKISFTGSTAVGKQLAALAGLHMKRVTMELGGHAPVIVFDDADVQVAAKAMAASKFRNAGQVCIAPTRFLVQDTHWTPAWMGEVARQLAARVGRVGRLPPVARPAWHEVARPVTRVGDLVDMLKLPEGQTVFAPETVTTRAIQTAAGDDWQPDETADVLLLGDSFTNVFSLEAMGWGTAAGLAPQLAFALGRPVDVIAQNDSGAFATRQALARELSSGHDRLAGKRVVVWELASRELGVGDWKAVEWKAP